MDPVNLDAHDLARLLAVGRGLVLVRDPEAVLRRVLEEARALTGAQYAALGILDQSKSALARFLTAGIDDELRSRIGPLPRGHGILGELIRDPRPLRLSDIGEHPRSYGFPAEHPQMRTFLGVPVKIRDEVYGNLYLTEKADGAEFDQRDEQLLVVLAEWAAVAIDNARAHAASRRHQAQVERGMRALEATASLNREVIGRTDFDRVAELVVKRARALADARSAALVLGDSEDMTITAVAGEADPNLVGRQAVTDRSMLTDVLHAGRGMLIPPEVGSRLLDLDSDLEGGILVPLRSRGFDLGVLAVFDRLDDQTSFTQEDVATLESFATSAATALAAARSLEDERLRLSIASSERERQRWARELHDETLQELGALNLLYEGASAGDDPERARRTLTGAQVQVNEIISGLQGLITDLRPAALDQLGTAAAVEVLVERARARTGLEIDLDTDLAYESGREPTRHTEELEATVYRLVQEALTNVGKHADAHRARVSVEERDDVVTVIVEDDGRGLPDEVEAGAGFGLVGMRERVALLGGDLELSAGAAGGTRVRAVLPVSRRPG